MSFFLRFCLRKIEPFPRMASPLLEMNLVIKFYFKPFVYQKRRPALIFCWFLFWVIVKARSYFLLVFYFKRLGRQKKSSVFVLGLIQTNLSGDFLFRPHSATFPVSLLAAHRRRVAPRCLPRRSPYTNSSAHVEQMKASFGLRVLEGDDLRLHRWFGLRYYCVGTSPHTPSYLWIKIRRWVACSFWESSLEWHWSTVWHLINRSLGQLCCLVCGQFIVWFKNWPKCTRVMSMSKIQCRPLARTHFACEYFIIRAWEQEKTPCGDWDGGVTMMGSHLGCPWGGDMWGVH